MSGKQRHLVLCVLLITLAGCGDCQCGLAVVDDSGAPCIDADGDGFGDNCDRGPDCDDTDRYLNRSCDCSATSPGCPCTEGDSGTCYEGRSGTLGIGPCQAGTATCDVSTGRFGPCVGQILPLEQETCNNTDDNCNGEVDEGVMSLCGTCNPNCVHSDFGPGTGNAFATPTEDNSSGVILDDDGNIVLDPGVAAESFHYLYIANTSEGTVSKVDVESLQEVGRYTSALHTQNVATGSEALPSRTAVDGFGDVWVANRAHGGSNRQGSVTKIAGSGCQDRNHNGSVDTSQDIDGDGIISMDSGFVDPSGQGRLEYYGDDDECVLFTIPIGAANAIPRALGLSGSSEFYPSGLVFVGTWQEKRFYVLSGYDGSLVPINNNPIEIDLEPYGAVVDSKGNVWTTRQDSDRVQALRIGNNGLVKSPVFSHSGNAAGMRGSYGIAVDDDDRVWTGGYAGDNPPNTGTAVYRFTPSSFADDGLPSAGSWDWVDPMVNSACANSHTRGVNAHKDNAGNTWIWTGVTSGCVGVVNADTMTVEAALDPPGAHQFIGVGADFLIDPRTGVTHIWAISNTGNSSDRDIGEAVRITYDYASHSALAYDTVVVGKNPYTYSDFTGYGLRSFTTRSGSYVLLIQGCPFGETSWEKVLWNATVPEVTQVCMRAVALEAPDLGSAGLGTTAPACQAPPGGDAELDLSGLPASPFLLVEASLMRLAPTTTNSPVLRSIRAAFTCSGGG